MKIKSRHHLKASEARKITGSLDPFLSDAIPLKAKSLEMAETDGDIDLIFVNGKAMIMVIDGRPFFTVKGAIDLQPKGCLVVVDSGAVRFISNGADVMAPGIVKADEGIAEGDMVVVVEETYGKPLAIGKALVPGRDMMGEGKVVKSLHHVGDHIWKGIV